MTLLFMPTTFLDRSITTLLVGFLFNLLFSSCLHPGDRDEVSQEENLAAFHYEQAKLHASANEYDSAMVYLGRALEEGMTNPMQIPLDSKLQVLIDDPTYRPQIRSLLRDYASDDEAAMVSPGQVGAPIQVSGKVVDELSDQPLADVIIELVHTDHDGYYFYEQSTWNPSIFAFLRTNEEGGFSISSIKPGRYQDDDGQWVPSHIHFTLEKEGYRTYASEFILEDDSIFQIAGNQENLPVASLKSAGQNKYFVRLAMQKK